MKDCKQQASEHLDHHIHNRIDQRILYAQPEHRVPGQQIHIILKPCKCHGTHTVPVKKAVKTGPDY